MLFKDQATTDRRQRLLHLTQAGIALETRLTSVQGSRFAAAYREAGVDAVDGVSTSIARIAGQQYD